MNTKKFNFKKAVWKVNVILFSCVQFTAWLKMVFQLETLSMWPSQIENDPQSQLPGGHKDPWKIFWRENPEFWPN